MKVLITGSRGASVELRDAALHVVEWCRANGHEVLVGDCPDPGDIDRIVVDECRRLGVRLAIHGLRRHGVRLLLPFGCGATLVECNVATFPERNEVMAQACDRCVGIWDERSTGTVDTMRRSARMDKPVQVYVWDPSTQRCELLDWRDYRRRQPSQEMKPATRREAPTRCQMELF